MKKIKLRTQNTNNHIVSNVKEYSWVELEFDGKRVVFEATDSDNVLFSSYGDTECVLPVGTLIKAIEYYFVNFNENKKGDF